MKEMLQKFAFLSFAFVWMWGMDNTRVVLGTEPWAWQILGKHPTTPKPHLLTSSPLVTFILKQRLAKLPMPACHRLSVALVILLSQPPSN